MLGSLTNHFSRVRRRLQANLSLKTKTNDNNITHSSPAALQEDAAFFLVAVDPSAKSKNIFGGLVENRFISTKKLKSKDPTQQQSSFSRAYDADEERELFAAEGHRADG